MPRKDRTRPKDPGALANRVMNPTKPALPQTTVGAASTSCYARRSTGGLRRLSPERSEIRGHHTDMDKPVKYPDSKSPLFLFLEQGPSLERSGTESGTFLDGESN
jgi:hypothetical protein